MHKFDDYEDPFDFDDLGDRAEDQDLGRFDEGDDGPPRHAPHTAHALVAGETGVSFEALVLFAEPLFELYELDLADAFVLKTRPDAADPDVLAVLETARLLWAFYSLPPAARARRRNALAAHLVGPEPSEDDWLDIEALLETVAPYWKAMLPEERAKAERTAHPTLGFDALLQHPAFALGPAHDAQTYGPDDLSEIEARARFAQPLLDDPAALTDPDALEAAMDRASAYWTLAQAPPAEREQALDALLERLAGGNGERAALEREARRMVERFETLFPEHAKAA